MLTYRLTGTTEATGSTTTNGVDHDVERARALGLEKDTRIHDLRHTHASWLIAAGRPLPSIQRRLGHESITTTVDTYGHLMMEVDEGNLGDSSAFRGSAWAV